MNFCLYHLICLNRMQWTHIGNQEAIELSTLEGLIHTQMLYLFGGVGFQKEIVLLILGKCSYSPIAFSMVDLSSGLTPSANSASPFLMSPRIVLRSTMMPFASCIKKDIIIDQHNHDHLAWWAGVEKWHVACLPLSDNIYYSDLFATSLML